MSYTKDDRKELDRKRGLMREAFQRCAARGFDARPLLEPYKRICIELRKIGGKPETPEYCSERYWQDDTRWANQENCKNKIIGVDEDFNIIRERPIVSMKPRKVTISKSPEVPQEPVESNVQLAPTNEPMVGNPQPQPISQKYFAPKTEPEIGYYRINISWTEKPDVNYDSITKMQFVFKELQLEQKDIHELNNGHEVEKTIEYKFKGTYDGYIMLKRAVMAFLDALAGTQEFNIAIHGAKIDYDF